MKLLLQLLLIFISVELFAPNLNDFIVVKDEPISYYEILADAVVMVESRGNPLAYNPDEGAVGAFQIRQIRVDDYNKKTNNNYKVEDFYDLELSRECFLYYARINKEPELIAKRWNGSGPKTIEYWRKVKKYL